MKKLVSIFLSSVMLFGSVSAANLVPASEYEHLTSTKYTDYLTHYHMTLAETIEDNQKGGEGFQCMFAHERSDDNADYIAKAYDTCGIYYTKDGGENWRPEEEKPGYEGYLSQGVCDLEYAPGNPEILFSYRWGVDWQSVNSGLYISEDGGKTSRRIYTFVRTRTKSNYDGFIKFGKYNSEKGINPMFVVQNAEGTGTAWKNAGLYVSYNWNDPDNITFEPVAFNNPQEDGLISRFQMSHDKEVMVVNIGRKRESNGTWVSCTGGLYVSFDQGKTWSLRSNGIEEFRMMAIGIDPINSNHWIVSPYARWEKDSSGKETGDVMLYETKDAGVTWKKMSITTWNKPILKDVSVGNKTRAISKGSAIVREIKIGFPSTAENTAVSVGTQPIYISLDESTWPFRVSLDGGKNFGYMNDDHRHKVGKEETGWYGDPIALSEKAPNEALMGMWRTWDSGYTFKVHAPGVSGKLCTAFLFGEDGQLDRVAGFDLGVFKIAQGYEGEFPPLEPMYRDNAFSNQTAMDLTADPNDPNHIWGVAGSSSYSIEEILIETSDNFAHSRFYVNMQMRRRAKAEANGVSTYDHDKVEYSSTNDNVLISGLFYSQDNGKTWRESQYKILDIDNFNEKVCYAMGDTATNTKNQIMISYDGAKTWQSTGISIPNVRRCLVADESEPFVIWLAEAITTGVRLHKVDLKEGSIKTIGREQGLASGREGAGLQLDCLSISKLHPNVMFVNGTDYYGRCGFNFISYDYGMTWMKVPGLPPGTSNCYPDFHPTKTQLWMGGPLGIWVFDYGKYAADNGIEMAPAK